jgi:hypothetical protein
MLISLPDQWNSAAADAILELEQSQFDNRQFVAAE